MIVLYKPNLDRKYCETLFFLEDVYPRYRVHNKVVFCSLIFEELPSSLIPESAQMKTKNLNDNDDTYFPCTILVCIIRNYIIK